MSTTLEKLQVLQEAYDRQSDLNLLLDKLLSATLSQNRLLLSRYDRDLENFEKRFGMTSTDFYARFEAGELGDLMDYFEWAGLWELHQRLQEKIRRLEQAL
ncbi:MAG: hypothetical protein A2Z04_04460 [Chloroflexi bacterium RBG_16_57_9]|nr:MAG: hypothetical protein A2Z04_04460 [Chloroflexi bacterium RBG_16_57_9]